MSTAKKDMFNRLSQVSKSAPLQESAKEADVPEIKEPEIRKKNKVARKAKNLLIPQDLWEAYEWLKDNNTTSLLMTPYILEAFREKLAEDGAFNKNK
ncbi:molecular chaperone [Yersinia enterocolitica]|uniref:Molecular chaperone n=1 Tax=Yersinia pekkanenii TaxID=1288385 RepID=A0ABP1ZWW9_9GAMM|nr:MULTISPECIES: hypothetical protein [Yersinia]EKN4180872.1 molecular chaperone [Yersinia enterocolitica]MBW5840149.1 molecular chaperone [Yersinia enterocolitica]MBW5848757.1 molecular chaperone [Yersinia enterocolitica]MBW5857517.1 molecular chaperone [Yersinia enterocolitica]MBW5861841.1 molecular chaperone [Yersinia enterocolitica]